MLDDVVALFPPEVSKVSAGSGWTQPEDGISKSVNLHHTVAGLVGSVDNVVSAGKVQNERHKTAFYHTTRTDS